MWQPDTFDVKRIDAELRYLAQGSLGMNVMRVFLHDLLWSPQNVTGLMQRMDQFLSVCQSNRIRVLFVLFDSCWDPMPELGA